MNAVFSLSTISKDARQNLLYGNASLKITYILFTLSVLQAKKYFNKVILETDDDGYDLLINKLKLPFDEINLTLNSLDKEFSEFWMLGKIAAYNNQKDPFIHLDLDYVIYSPFADEYLNSEVFSENPEAGNYFNFTYLDKLVNLSNNLTVMPECFGKSNRAVCMGIIGFNDINICKGYCSDVYKILFSKENSIFIKSLEDKKNYCIIFEQYMLECYMKHIDKTITYLNSSLDKTIAAKQGKCHYLTHKKDIKKESQFESIIYSLYPESYSYICSLLNEKPNKFLNKLTIDEILNLY